MKNLYNHVYYIRNKQALPVGSRPVHTGKEKRGKKKKDRADGNAQFNLEAIDGEEAADDAFLEPRPQHDHVVLLIHPAGFVLANLSLSLSLPASLLLDLTFSLAKSLVISCALTVYREGGPDGDGHACAEEMVAASRGDVGGGGRGATRHVARARDPAPVGVFAGSRSHRFELWLRMHAHPPTTN